MRVLVACEFSGVVREAFRKRGHDAWSCDLLPAMDSSPSHMQYDVLNLLHDKWDLMIAHPPCTWLCQAMRTNAARKDRPNITPVFESERKKAYDFVLALSAAPIGRISIENPIGYPQWKLAGTRSSNPPLDVRTRIRKRHLPLAEAMGEFMTISTWSDIQAQIRIRKLPWTVLRLMDQDLPLSTYTAGRLISTATGETLASTVEEAKRKLEEGL